MAHRVAKRSPKLSEFGVSLVFEACCFGRFLGRTRYHCRQRDVTYVINGACLPSMWAVVLVSDEVRYLHRSLVQGLWQVAFGCVKILKYVFQFSLPGYCGVESNCPDCVFWHLLFLSLSSRREGTDHLCFPGWRVSISVFSLSIMACAVLQHWFRVGAASCTVLEAAIALTGCPGPGGY